MSINMKNPGTEFTPKSAEEERKEKRKRKWELIAGAVGDGMSAVSNLIFSCMGAPSGVITTTGKVKSTNKSLIEAIKGKHAAQDAEYGKKLTAWEKEEEKKRKDAEKLAKENETVDIHKDFNPLAKHWDDKDYIAQMYESLRSELDSHLKTKGIKESKALKELERTYKDNSARVLPYMQQSILNDILSGEMYGFDDDQKNEIDEEFLSKFRNQWSSNDKEWVKMK